ncbi:potassium transporter TrkH [Pokkaliibacter plantistimulans]|uniref:Trk system potassium uptake protein n=1 Tax=Proteobacteria bacterium 228 TaxID=2083153 RepID=A0A2S5KW67_9PROT|nr:TrkH family potassium uptake protein [Pokkaliibacter plantistimulans]PPC79094.1 potassium transporter TrkH [Pokkaliibacter plantistimulans]
MDQNSYSYTESYGPERPLTKTLSRLRALGFVLGAITCFLSLFMLPPWLLLIFEGDSDRGAFALSFILALGSGLTMLGLGYGARMHLRARHLFLLTVLSWLVLSFFGALPFMFSRLHLSLTDAIFETVSGITTTGSTVLSNLPTLSHGMLLWRGLLQWMGGIGIIVMAMAILPFLRVGGMKLFQTESSDRSDNHLPNARALAASIGKVYGSITLLCLLTFWIGGMRFFDALVHALATVSTGGFGNYDDSFAHFTQPFLAWAGSFFMLLSALPLALYGRIFKRTNKPIWQDDQVKGLLRFLLFVIVILAIWLKLQPAYAYMSWEEAFRYTTFNVISVVTTTGFAYTDYTQWGAFAVLTFFFLTFMGGCSGSTSGGIKMFRFQLCTRALMGQLHQLLHPRAIREQRYNGRTVSDEVLRAIIAFAFFYCLTVALIGLALTTMGLDVLTSLSGAATAVSNVGPGIGDIIGPAGNFASLPDGAKWLLAFGMLMGRLEILTVLVLLIPNAWRW